MNGTRSHPAADRTVNYVATASVLLLGVLSGCSGEFPAPRSDLRAAAAAYDAALMKRSLEAIAAWHTANDTGVAESLNDGVPAERVAERLAGPDCRATEELTLLWSWKNGEASAHPLVWYHDFLSLDEALAEYRALIRHPFVRWDPRYLPLFVFEGEWYAAYCGPGAGRAGPVVHVLLEDEPEISHTNLTTFLAGMADALHSGAVRWDAAQEAMVEDIRALRRIHDKHNPGHPFPYFVPEDP